MNFRLITKWWDVEGFCSFIFHMDVILEHFVENIIVLVLKYIGNFIENSTGVGLFLYYIYFYCLSFHQYYTFVSKAL